MNRRAILLGMALAFSCVAHADHGEKHETTLSGGGLVTSTSWKSNYLIYRSIGGETEVQSAEMKRKWWCLWLCKRRVSKNAQSIEILNTYFAEVSPGVFARLERANVCTNASSCQQKEWAFGAGVTLNFPNGGSPSPGQLSGLLPVDGVITRHTIVVDNQTIVQVTSAGKHPPNIIL